MRDAEALHATLAMRPVDGDDEQLERAHAALDEATAALHELASVTARRELGEDWLPMISRLRAQKASAEQTVREIRRKRGLLARAVGWENLTEDDRWATLKSMAPLGALVGPVVGYRNPRGRLSFIIDDEPHPMTDPEPT